MPRIVPVYLNFGNWASDFANLSTHLNTIYCDNLIVIWDFNARCGNEQLMGEEDLGNNASFNELRNSQDMVLNDKGKRFLEMLSDLSLVIFNGRLEGSLTFCGAIWEILL